MPSKGEKMNTEKKKVMLSGVKPTGRTHIGNYFGAMRQFVELQDTYETYVMIADLHALTTVQNREEMSQAILDVAIDYLAIGLDPKKVTIFKQSDVPAHAELAWIFDCITTVPYLMRAHAFKDAEAKNKELNVGVFNYPMLMAADILLYDTDVVPVGQDQKQHVEITRDTAEKFNRVFGNTFKLPEALILKDVAVVPGIDGQKMSKSYNNTIPLFASDEEIRRLVMSTKTGSEKLGEPIDPHKCNVFALHKLFSSETILNGIRRKYKEGKLGYRGAKELLVDEIKTFTKPLREKRTALEADKTRVLNILKSGGEKARAVASKKMEKVHELVGANLYG